MSNIHEDPIDPVHNQNEDKYKDEANNKVNGRLDSQESPQKRKNSYENSSQNNNQNANPESDDYEKKMLEILKKEIEHHSHPMWLTTQFVKKPYHVILVSAIFFIICLVLMIVADLFAFTETNNRDYLIFDHHTVVTYDQILLAKEEFYDNSGDSQIPERSYNQYLWGTSFVLECDLEESENCKNVLTAKNIEALAKFEKKIKKISGYDDFCLASTSNTECTAASMVSITNLFSDPTNISNSDLDSVLQDILDDSNKFESYKFLFDQSFKGNNKKSPILRTFFQFGAPIAVDGKLKKDQYDDEEGQLKEFEAFTKKMISELKSYNPLKGTNLIAYSYTMYDIEQQEQVNKDFLWALGSIMFVWFYLTIHLKSLFLSSVSMLNILISFPISLVFFELICQVTYFSSLHVLAIFIILGIAADNIFVFIDCWRQALRTPEYFDNDETKIMAFTFRRASNAMLATSSTTAAAFFATGFSTIMPICSFGIFAGILVPVNFLLVILFFPAIVIVYEHQVKFMCTKNNKDQKKIRNKPSDQEEVESQEGKKEEQEKKQEDPWIVRFFNDQFNTFVFKRRLIILAVFSIWCGIAAWRSANLEPISEMEEFMPEDFYTIKARRYIMDDFHRSGSIQGTSVDVSFFWGTDGVDKTDVIKWDSSYMGDIKWDKDFDFAAPESQEYLLEFCEDVATHSLVLDENVECFIIPFKQYLTDNNIAFPVTNEQDLIDHLLDFSKQTTGYIFWAKGHIGIIKNKLRFIEIQLTSKGELGVPAAKMEPLYDDWQEFKEKENKKAPKGMNNGHQTAGFSWVWLQSEKAFVSNAMQGMAISLVFAFVVLMITTKNVLMSTYSVISILGIVMSVIAIMELQGWQLGISESITIVIVIGLSVDYVVHLANHFTESVYPDRFRKIQTSLKDIGISIVSGAITTLGAGTFLFFAVIVMFNKFAILIVTTIMFSLGFSLMFFSAIMHQCGPEGDTGNYVVFFRKMKAKYDSRKNGGVVETISNKDIEENAGQKPSQLNIQEPQSNTGLVKKNSSGSLQK